MRKYQGVLVSDYWRDRLPLVNVRNYKFSTTISNAAASLVVLKVINYDIFDIIHFVAQSALMQ